MGEAYTFTKKDAERIQRAVRAFERSGGLPVQRRRVIGTADGGGGGAGIKRAFCLTNAMTEETIRCSIDIDASNAESWNSGTNYALNDSCIRSDFYFKSLQANNQNHDPVDLEDPGWWERIDVSVLCNLIGSTSLAACFPSLSKGVWMPVYNSGGAWYSVWWFQVWEQCD